MNALARLPIIVPDDDTTREAELHRDAESWLMIGGECEQDPFEDWL